MEHKLVSVGIPVYNEGEHIAELLRSVSSQEYPRMEILVSDNASSDNTWEIVREYAAKDKRFRIVRQPNNMGADFNFKYVLENATGEYFIWAGGHDRWCEGMITACAGNLDENPGVMLCAPETKWVDSDGGSLNVPSKIIDTRRAGSQAERVLLFYKQIDRCSSIYGLHRRKCLLSTLPWPRVVGPDLITLLRIVKAGDIVTERKVYWCRRRNRTEKAGESQRRQIRILGITGLAAKYPNGVSRIAVIREVYPASGNPLSRLRLLAGFAWRLFFKPAQFSLLCRELLQVR